MLKEINVLDERSFETYHNIFYVRNANMFLFLFLHSFPGRFFPKHFPIIDTAYLRIRNDDSSFDDMKKFLDKNIIVCARDFDFIFQIFY